MTNPITCHLCGSKNTKLISKVDEKPEFETDYQIKKRDYYREIRQCLECLVYFNNHGMNLITEDFYSGKYNEHIGTGNLVKRFEKIKKIPFEESDNKQRVERVDQFVRHRFSEEYPDIALLDVGTGTGVFVHEFRKRLTNVCCVDPDRDSIDLVNKKIDLKQAWLGSVKDVPKTERFEIIALNKVLEHVEKPIQLLSECREYLKPKGIVYIELPYATNIIKEQKQNERGEFAIEHFTIFNVESFEYLLSEACFRVLDMKNIIDPSGKETIYAFSEKR